MRPLAVLFIATLVALAGCADEGEDNTPSPTDTNTATDTMTPTETMTETTGTTTQDVPPRGPVTWEVDIVDNSFPDDITIQVGDTVRWTHAGTAPHSVTADDGTFDSHPNCLPVCMASGETYEFTFDTVGEVPYHCKVHASMTGQVTVLERYDATPA